MLNIDEGLRALSAVQKVLPKAMLAGGYLRDAMADKPQKDIDIFVPHIVGPGSFLQMAFPKDDIKLMVGTQYMPTSEVSAVYDLAGFSLPVQIIVMAPGCDLPQRIINHDFGICQIWHDGRALQWTGGFERDLRDKTFSLIHCEDTRQFDRSMRRWERLCVKYHEYSLVVPEDMPYGVQA